MKTSISFFFLYFTIFTANFTQGNNLLIVNSFNRTFIANRLGRKDSGVFLQDNILVLMFFTLWQSTHETDDVPNIPKPSAQRTHWVEPFPAACFFILSKRSISFLRRIMKRKVCFFFLIVFFDIFFFTRLVLVQVIQFVELVRELF